MLPLTQTTSSACFEAQDITTLLDSSQEASVALTPPKPSNKRRSPLNHWNEVTLSDRKPLILAMEKSNLLFFPRNSLFLPNGRPPTLIVP